MLSENLHIKEGHDLVCSHKTEHFRLDLAFDIQSPKRQDGHRAGFEVVVASDSQGLSFMGRTDFG